VPSIELSAYHLIDTVIDSLNRPIWFLFAKKIAWRSVTARDPYWVAYVLQDLIVSNLCILVVQLFWII
jgi:hypothetical protein